MNRLTLILGVLALVGWGAFFWLLKKPQETFPPTIVTKHEDRVQVQTVVREVSKPNGTVVKETIVSQSKTKEATVTKATKAPLSRWSLGIRAEMSPEHLLDSKLIYGLTVGHRIWDSPIWIQAGLTTRKELTLGLSVEF